MKGRQISFLYCPLIVKFMKKRIDPHINVRVYNVLKTSRRGETSLKIGELSKLTGVSIRSLRYYEEQGILSPLRLENGYREYHDLAVEQVNTIKFYLSLGLSIEQISGFLHCVLKKKEAFCTEVLPIYEEKLEELDQQIELLTMIRSNLVDRITAIKSEQIPPFDDGK